MHAFEGRFILSPRPQVETLEPRPNEQWLRFTDSSEILALVRFASLKGLDQPDLLFRCERGAGRCAITRDGFKVGFVLPSARGASIYFPQGPEHREFVLDIVPGKTSDPAGGIVSCVETLERRFPMGEYTRLRADIMRAPAASPFVPRL